MYTSKLDIKRAFLPGTNTTQSKKKNKNLPYYAALLVVEDS